MPAGRGESLVPRRVLYVLGLLAAVKGVALVLAAEAIARGISSIAQGTTDWRGAIVLGVVAGAVRAVAGWATTVAAARAAIGTKESIRRRLATRMLDAGGNVGSATTLATRGLDELDEYFTAVLPAMTAAAAIPLVIGARILFADWLSVIVIVITVPMVPLFMALVGQHTRERTSAAAAALDRLSDHVVELARGLPVLVGLGRVKEQAASLERISDQYRRTTMSTLRTAFLSSLVLELIATISVAVVAVFIGVRLVSGDLTLEVGLLVLVLAPECYSPLRDLGAAFHASRAGRLALDRARQLIEPVATAFDRRSGETARVRDLAVSFGDVPIVRALSFSLPATGITAIVGESGSGKSTVLRALAGRSDPDATVTGTIEGIDAQLVGWAPQHPHTVAPTVRGELELYAHGRTDAHELADALLRRLGLLPLAESDPAQLSPGELRRVALARAALRVDAGARLVLLDEPTAHLDDANATVVIELIEELGRRSCVVVASHDSGVRDLATSIVRVGRLDGSHDRAPAGPPALQPVRGPVPAGSTQQGGARRALASFLGAAPWRYSAAIVLGFLSSAFAVALIAVSAWLIVRASDHAAMMYLLVAIVGVRFFGLGRAALRYAERLVTHDAVLDSTTRLRMRLWRGLAALGPGSRALLRGGTALDYLVSAADNVRELVPRVVLPAAVGLSVAGVAVATMGILYPPAIAPMLVVVVIALGVAPAVGLAADRASTADRLRIRSDLLRRFAAMLGAADDLRGNGADGPVREALDAADRRAGIASRRSALARGLGTAIAVLACSGGAMVMLGAAARGVASGAIDVPVAAVLVLLPLALIEPIVGAVAAVQQWPTLAVALRRSAELDASTPAAIGTESLPPVIDTLVLERLAATWPNTGTAVFSGVSATVHAGDWLVVHGPSGAGKSTMLSVLLGYLRPSGGRVIVGGVDASLVDPDALLRQVAWCPQEAHLFDSTVRANLLLGRRRDDPPTEAELIDVLRLAGLSALVESWPNGLDTRIGSEGAHLSGGERQRLAVARTLLSRAGVVLLDEPTAHLDEPTADALMRDLRVALRGRIVVLVTHRPADRYPADTVLDLAAAQLQDA